MVVENPKSVMDQAGAVFWWFITDPGQFFLYFLAYYGWLVIFSVVGFLVLRARLRPALERWRQAREDAEDHKNPDRRLAREERVMKAREEMQRRLAAASVRAEEEKKEREEKKRRENEERLQKYGTLATKAGLQDDNFLPLSGGASTSSYRPPRRSACAGGGCGR